MDLSLGFLSCNINLPFCFGASTILSWFLLPCSIVWDQKSWFLQVCFSFSRLRWLFRVFCVSRQTVLLLWKMSLVIWLSTLWWPRGMGWGGCVGGTREKGDTHTHTHTHTHTYSWFMLLYSRNQHNIVKQLCSIKILKIKKKKVNPF